MLLYLERLLLTTLVMSLSIIFITGNGSPVLIKTGKKGKDKMILISGGKCGSPTLIKGSKKGGSEMILVGGQQDCEKPKVQIMKQFVPIPYYIPRPIYKYILRHHYVPVRQVVVKPVPVPYPVKSYSGNMHSNYNYGGNSGHKSSYGSYGSTQRYGDYNNYNDNDHTDSYYGGHGGYSKSSSTFYGNGNEYDHGNYATGSQMFKYSTKTSPSNGPEADDPYYGGIYGNKDFNGVYKSAYDSQGDSLSTTSMQIESFLKHNNPQYQSKGSEDSTFPSNSNYLNDDYDSKGMFGFVPIRNKTQQKQASSSSSSSASSSPFSSSSSTSSPSSSQVQNSDTNSSNTSSTPIASASTVSTYFSSSSRMPKSTDSKSFNWKRLEKNRNHH